jgi:hypothetical protein
MPEKEVITESGMITEALKWVWLGLLGLGGYVWNNLASQVKANEAALVEHKNTLSDHVMDDIKSHDDFVHKDDWQEMKQNIYARFDKLDAKSDKILAQVNLGVGRVEFKAELKDVYGAIEDLRKTKVDK